MALDPAGKFDARNVDGAPEDISRPDGDGEADTPAEEEAQAVLEVGLFARDAPDVGHEGVAQGMEDGTVDDVKGKRDLAQVLRESVGEQLLNFLGVVDAADDKHGADGLGKPVGLGVGLRDDLVGPHVEGGPAAAGVGGGAQVEADEEQADPELATGEVVGEMLQGAGERKAVVGVGAIGGAGRTLPGAVDQVGLGQEHAAQEEDDVPATPAHAEPDQAADEGQADGGLGAGGGQDGEEEHDGAAELDGDGPEVGVVVIVVEGPVPGVHEGHDGQVPVPVLVVEVLHQLGVLLVGALDGVAFLDDPKGVVVAAHAHGDEDGRQADDGGDVEAQAAAEGGGGQGEEGLIEHATADGLDGFVGEDVAGDDEEDGDHDMTRDDHVEDGQLPETVVFAIEPPTDGDLPGVGEEEVEVEDQETGPAAQAVQGGDGMKAAGLGGFAAHQVLPKARGKCDQKVGEGAIDVRLPIIEKVIQLLGDAG